MNPLAALAVKTIGAGTAAALLSLGVAGGLAQAASPSPKPTPPAATKPTKPDPHKDRRAIFVAVFESEADVLHITPAQLRADLRQGPEALELRLALLPEGRDPLVRILGHEHPPDRLSLHCQAKVQWPAEAQCDRELRVSDGDAWPGGKLRRIVDRARTARGGVGKQL